MITAVSCSLSLPRSMISSKSSPPLQILPKHKALSSMLMHDWEDQRIHIFSNLLCDDEETFVVLEELVHPHDIWMVLFIKAKMRS